MPTYLRETNRYRMMLLISAVEFREVYTNKKIFSRGSNINLEWIATCSIGT